MNTIKIYEIKYFDGEYYQYFQISCYQFKEINKNCVEVNGALIEMNGEIKLVKQLEVK